MSAKFHETLALSPAPVPLSNGCVGNIERWAASLPGEPKATFVLAFATGGASMAAPLCIDKAKLQY